MSSIYENQPKEIKKPKKKFQPNQQINHRINPSTNQSYSTHKTQPVSALVVVRHGAALAAPAVIAVALGVQAGTVHAPPARRVKAVV